MTERDVLAVEDIPVRGAVATEVDGVPVALVRTAEDVVSAVHNICSHEHYELAPEGWVGRDSIECAKHGSEFDLATGVPRGLPAVAPIPVYACRVVAGRVRVDVAAPRNDAAPPRH